MALHYRGIELTADAGQLAVVWLAACVAAVPAVAAVA